MFKIGEIETERKGKQHLLFNPVTILSAKVFMYTEDRYPLKMMINVELELWCKYRVWTEVMLLDDLQANLITLDARNHNEFEKAIQSVIKNHSMNGSISLVYINHEWGTSAINGNIGIVTDVPIAWSCYQAIADELSINGIITKQKFNIIMEAGSLIHNQPSP